MISLTEQDLQRFHNKYEPVTESGCWIWTAATFHFGHGVFKLKGKTVKAHRVSYEIHVGEIPDGMCVLHKCDVPECVNPKHLFVGTKTDNAKDRDNKGRTTKGEQCHLSKLSKQQVAEIRTLTYFSAKEIAKLYNVSAANIRTIRRKVTWK